MADFPPTEPDPRTAADDDEDATGDLGAGQSSPAPAEGPDDTPGERAGSPKG